MIISMLDSVSDVLKSSGGGVGRRQEVGETSSSKIQRSHIPCGCDASAIE